MQGKTLYLSNNEMKNRCRKHLEKEEQSRLHHHLTFSLNRPIFANGIDLA